MAEQTFMDIIKIFLRRRVDICRVSGHYITSVMFNIFLQLKGVGDLIFNFNCRGKHRNTVHFREKSYNYVNDHSLTTLIGCLVTDVLL